MRNILFVILLLMLFGENLHAQSSKSQWVEGTQVADDGATRDYYNRAAQLAWTHPMGDWRDADGAVQGSTAYSTIPLIDDDTPAYIEWDVTALVQAWVAGIYPNKGLFLRRVLGSGTFNFYSREHGDADQHPELVVVTPGGTHTLPAAADVYLDPSTYQCLGDSGLLRISDIVVSAAPDTIPGTLRSYATIYSIGIEWDITGDDDHDATCQVQYRKQGASAWKEAMPLFRVDFNDFNGFAGSILFLEPTAMYEIRLQLIDPDGGVDNRTESIATLAVPVKPRNGRTLHVVPGSGGGSGSASSPFQGIAAAQAAAQPGDIFLLHAGRYDGFDGNGEIQLNRGGTPVHYLVWQAADDGEVIFDPVRIAADYIWLEGVHIEGNADIDNEYGLRTYNAPEHVVIIKNRFTDFYYSIALNHGGENWVITDNTIIGDKDVLGVPDGPPSYGGEGIELTHTSGHTVAYNSISRVADGISYPHHNCDIFGNDIFDVTDDGIEPDYGYANIRIWGNRISNARHAGISFQPMNSGPWYIVRNQVAAGNEALKLRESTRALIVHNTFVGWEGVQAYGSERLLNFQSNNNLWVTVTDRYVWENGLGGDADWRTNLDYDGFDWGNNVYAFKWGANARYRNLEEFQAATRLEPHAVRINKDTCFKTFDVPAAPPVSMPFQHMILKNDCNAVDAGIRLPNINGDFTGNAPDLGAYETGAPLPHYGPREDSERKSAIPSLLPLLLSD